MAGWRVTLVLLPLLCTYINIVNGVCNSSWDSLSEKISNEEYRFYNPPWTQTGTGSVVGLKLELSSLKSSGPSDLRLDFHFLQNWTDPRVCYNASSLPLGQTLAALSYKHQGSLWSPDIYPGGNVRATQHTVTLPNVFIRIKPDGTVLKSNRLSVMTECPLAGTRFPYGSQRCVIKFKSYSFTKDEVSLLWLDQGYSLMEDFMSNVYLEKVEVGQCFHSLFMDEQSCVQMVFHLSRDYGVFFLRIYLPSAMVVFLSWISLWIDVRQVAARTGLSVLCVLTLMTQSLGLMMTSESEDGVLAVDVWMFVCLSFTVWAMSTFVITHYIDYTRQKQTEKKRRTTDDGGTSTECRSPFHFNWEKIEAGIRLFYPISFIIFNIVYWAYFLSV